MLVIFRGLPGTGKSHLVHRLTARRPDLLVLSRDVLRAALIAHPTFREDEKALIDDMIVSMAGFLLGRGRDVVIDGMALSSARRVAGLWEAAVACGVEARIVECVCREETALSRIGQDTGAHPAGDRGAKLYHEVKTRYQTVSYPSLVVDTDRDTEENLNAIISLLGAERQARHFTG
jgi:predicted kinase